MAIDMTWVVGQVIEAVSYDDEGQAWWFGFRRRGGLRATCPWQILVAGKLVRASGDHSQQYGLPARIDAAAEATNLLAGREVEAVEVDPASADLTITFQGAATLRTFSDTLGYEVWLLTSGHVGPGGEEVFGQGGRAVP